jgi:hypothetical protein
MHEGLNVAKNLKHKFSEKQIDFVIANRDNILRGIAPRHNPNTVQVIVNEIAPFVEATFADEPAGSVALAMQALTDYLLATMVDWSSVQLEKPN